MDSYHVVYRCSVYQLAEVLPRSKGVATVLQVRVLPEHLTGVVCVAGLPDPHFIGGRMARSKSQAEQILAHLREGNTLTDLDSLQRFGCRRLAARIRDLRLKGHPIITETETTLNGAKIARYKLEMKGQMELVI